MNSLRELTRSFNMRECRLQKWIFDRRITLPVSLRRIMNAYAPATLPGFADLHAHPASHLAFGANETGSLFWGTPGLRFEDSDKTLFLDLAPCDGRIHSRYGDFKVDIEKAIRDTINRWQKWPPGFTGKNALADAIVVQALNAALDPATISATTFAIAKSAENVAFQPFLGAAAAAFPVPGVPETLTPILASADAAFTLMDLGLAATVAAAVKAAVSVPGLDPVRMATRALVVSESEKYTHHGTFGWPSFESWPQALSVLHQQMHVTSVHRAWRGGLRLMIASVTDNQLLAKLWNISASGHPVWPEVEPDFDFKSAKNQLQFIHSFVEANSNWMEIALSSAQARSVIAKNKLAVILGVEMDSLTANQIVSLKDDFGLRQVVPIHLANNAFGGVAVYDDLFNTSNWYLHGATCLSQFADHHLEQFFEVYDSECVEFKLGRSAKLGKTTMPQYLLAIPTGAVIPTDITEDDYRELAYGEGPKGHVNRRGLNPPATSNGPEPARELLKLMRAGLIIDLAHMSERSQKDALDLSDKYDYPLVNTHTGVREDQQGDSERSIRKSDVKRLANRGGVIGLGTSSTKANDDLLAQWISRYWEAWNAMGYHGVALGTDANGLSPLIAASHNHVDYKDAASLDSKQISMSSLGTRGFDYATTGIAHYGMLADFIQALCRLELGADIAEYLLPRTAEAVIAMWEQVEQAAMKVPGS